MLWCMLRFPHKIIFGWSLFSFVLSGVHVLLILFVINYIYWFPTQQMEHIRGDLWHIYPSLTIVYCLCNLEKKVQTVMIVNNYTNINRMNNHHLTQGKSKAMTWHWKSRSRLGTGIKMNDNLNGFFTCISGVHVVCFVKLHVFTFLVSCCDVCYDFHIK
jgi:hypothetical protein